MGTFTLTDRHGNPYYAFMSDAVIDTLQALIEVPPLAALTDFAKSLSEVTMRDIPNGADVGKVSFSKKRRVQPFQLMPPCSLLTCLKRSAPLRKKLSV